MSTYKKRPSKTSYSEYIKHKINEQPRLGKKIPNIDKYLLPIIGIAVAISFGPMLYHIAKNLFENYTKKKSAKIKSK